MKNNHILAALIVLPFAFVNAADEPTSPAKPKRDPAHLFKLMDHNNDGGISLDEYKASTAGQIDPSRVGDVFKKKDSDGDGKLSLTEFMYVPPREAAKPAAAPAKKEKKE
jgi:Ca2+-binding EF-hand superfamily protein